MIAVGDHVVIDGYVQAVPDGSDNRVPVGGGPSCPWEVLDVQDEAVLVRAYPRGEGALSTIFAVMGDDVAKLKLVRPHRPSTERERLLAAGLPEHAYLAGIRATDDVCDYCGERLFLDADDALVTRTQFGGFASGCSASLDRGGDGDHEPEAHTGTSAVDAIGWMDANIAAEQARDRERRQGVR